jgi:hypothetical protein
MASMTSSNRMLATAIVLSLALHVALLAGTPPVGFDWRYEAPAPLAVTIVPVAPVEIAPAPAARPPKKAVARGAREVRAPEPLPIPAAGLLDAPPPEGEPAVLAQAEPESAGVDPAGPATAEPVADAKPASEYPLKHARLIYDLYYATVNSGNGATRVGQLTHTWSLDGQRYEAEAVAEASGLVSLFFDGKFVQRSTGQLGTGGLVPERYSLDRGRGDRPESARFDWTARKLALEWKSESRTVDLPAGAQDPLSLLHQMYFVQPIPAAASVNIVTSRKLGRYVYQLTGEETLATPLGSVRTLRFRRREEGGTTMDVWFDMDRNLLPARIYAVDRKGNVLDQVIREARLEVADTAAVSRP